MTHDTIPEGQKKNDLLTAVSGAVYGTMYFGLAKRSANVLIERD